MLGVLWLLFRRTRWGVLVRAATQDREMAAALGVNQKWLFTSVFALGVFLAALGGALRIAARGGATTPWTCRSSPKRWSSSSSAGSAACPAPFSPPSMVSELNAFGILVLPGDSIVARVPGDGGRARLAAFGLARRPGRAVRAHAAADVFRAGARWTQSSASRSRGVLALAAALPFVAGDYWLGVATEVLIFVLYAASLHFLSAPAVSSPSAMPPILASAPMARRSR